MQRILAPTLIVSAALACSAGEAAKGSGSGGPDGSGAGASGGSIGLGGSGVNVGGVGGNVPALNGSIVSDSGNEITVSGEPASVTFSVELADGSPANGVLWTVDDTRIGSIGEDGVFHADGYVGGVVVITATVGGAEANFELIVNVDITENPGSVSEADQAALIAGGAGDAAFANLYPYDGTVFPRGLAAPVLQYAGTAAAATYTSISAPYFRYRQFAGASAPTRITLPEAVWRGLTLTMIDNEPVQVSVSKSSGAAVAGPVTTNWFIAPGQLKGIIYYSTYKSPLAMETVDTEQGAILRLRPGQTAEVVQGGCTVCHTVSARGNVLATGLKYSVEAGPEQYNAVDSGSFDLTPDGQMTERQISSNGRLFTFAGLSPDGSLAVTNGITPDGDNGYGWPPYVPRGVRAPEGYPSLLVDTTTATPIDAPSLPSLVTYALSPVFSPDGKRVAFVNGDLLPARVLSVMDFDGGASPPAFSNLQDVVTTANQAVAWPSFLPDGQGVVFHQGDSFDSSVFVQPPTAPSGPQFAELKLVSLADQSVSELNLLNGNDSSGSTYLPYGEVEEGRMNYEPSVLPVAIGGYYWVLFTSRRAYGNTIADGGTIDRGGDPWGTESDPSPRKKIWIAAIDVDYAGKVDASHPAFYLPGQEIESGNMRAYGALAPCKAEGETCESGADCCGGFCRETSRSETGQPIRQCVPPPEDTCSLIDELCATPADCCDQSNLCINGRCSLPPPK